MPPSPPEPRHPVLVRLLAVAVGVGVGALCFAALFEAYDRIAPDPDAAAPSARSAQEDPPAEQGTPATRFPYQPGPWFHRFAGRAVALRAHLAPFSAPVCTEQIDETAAPCGQVQQNSHGFRTPEYTLLHPPGTFRIVILGDSFTWGDGIPEEDTYHRQLQRRFDQSRAGRVPRVEVIALGVNGSNTLDEVIRLLAHGQRLAPDLVLVQFYENDFEYRASPLLALDSEGGVDFLLRATAMGRVLGGRLRDRDRARMHQEDLARQFDPDSLEWSLFRAALAAFARWREEGGAPLGFLAFSPVDARRDGRNFDHYREPPETLHYTERAAQEMEQQGFPVLHSLELFRERAGEHYLAVAPGNGHYGREASQIVADGLFEFLSAADWVDLRSPRSRVPDPRWGAEQALRQEAAEHWADYHQSYERQIAFFEQLSGLLPEDAWLAQTLGFIHKERDELPRCREHYERSGALDPEHAAPWFDLAYCTPEAQPKQELLVRMLHEVPDHAGAATMLAEVDALAGRIGRACGCQRRVAEVATDPSTYGKAVTAYRELACESVFVEDCPGPDPLAPL